MEIVDLEQNTQEWRDFRKKHIGASDIAPILGISPWKTAYKLWCEKTGKVKEDEPSNFMARGTYLEHEARLKYVETTSIPVMPQVQVFEKWDVAAASLDGISIDGEVICEIKCPGMNTYELARLDSIPDYYEFQMQWQLMCTGAKRCDYFVYVDSKTFVRLEVFPDLKLQNKLLDAAKAFWILVETDTPPEATDKDHVAILDPDANRLSLEWRELKMEMQAKENRLKKLEQDLLEFSDDGNCLFSESRVKITRVNRKGTVDWDKLCTKWRISEEEVEKYRKKNIGYPKFSFKA